MRSHESVAAVSRRYPSNIGTERLLYCDFLDPNADPRVYQEVEDIDKLKLVVNDFLEEHNAESKSPMPLARARRPFVLIRHRRDSWWSLVLQ